MMNKKQGIFSVTFLLLLFLLNSFDGYSQCAMCRTTLENNVNNGVMVASGLNFGILYLLAMPYLAITILAILWYKNSKKNIGKKRNYGSFAG